MDYSLAKVVSRILPENTMKTLLGTTRTLRVIAVADIGLASLAVLSGCGAAGIAPIVAPKQVLTNSPI